MLRQIFLYGCLGMLLLGMAACGANRAAPAEEFALYLLDEDPPTADFQASQLSTLRLADAPLISSADILHYDVAEQRIQLSDAAYQRVRELFTRPVDVDGIPFVVCVGEERIYGGAFWTPVSSLSYSGVVIMDDFASDPPFIRLTLGYPFAAVFTGDDPRADERIIHALEAAGKLSPDP